MKVMKVEKEIFWKSDFDFAHFLYFDYDSKCRRLHGHTGKVSIRIKGFPNKNGVVFDFNHLSEIIKNLDHKLIVSKDKIVDSKDGFYVVETQSGGSIKLSKNEVVVIPYPNVTSEYLSEYILDEIVKRMDDNVTWVKVCFWEDPRSKACSEAYVEFEEEVGIDD